jgi:hypothetical protein
VRATRKTEVEAAPADPLEVDGIIPDATLREVSRPNVPEAKLGTVGASILPPRILLTVGISLAILGLLIGMDRLIRPTPTNPELPTAMEIGG